VWCSNGYVNLAWGAERAAAGGWELVVVDSGDIDDDLVRDMTEIMASTWARRYGTRVAESRGKRASAAAAGVEDGQAA